MDGTDTLFPTEHHPDLARYLTDHVEHDPATGCLSWTGYLTPKAIAALQGQ